MSNLLDDDVLGRDLADALERRGERPMSIDVGAVLAGAQQRRTRRNLIGVVAALVLLAGGVVGFSKLRTSDEMVTGNPAPAATAPAIPYAAVLPADFGEPSQIYASPGWARYGAALPAIDVWDAGPVRVIVRTHASPLTAGEQATSSAPVTTLAAGAAPLSVVGEIRQLADDQWVQYRSDQAEIGDTVVVRGADKETAERIFDSMSVTDGVLTPPSEFTRSEHADAFPDSRPGRWFTAVCYPDTGSDDDCATRVTAAAPPEPGSSLEMLSRVSVGALRSVDGIEVIDIQDRYGRQVQWLDPRGVEISVSSNEAPPATLVSQVTLVDQAALETMAAAISARAGSAPTLAGATVDGVQVSVRGEPDDIRSCVSVGGDEQCSFDWYARFNEPSITGTMNAIVNGEWIIAGYLGGPEQPAIADDRYETPAGDILPVKTLDRDGYLWFVVRVPAGVNALNVESHNLSGTIERPLFGGVL